MNDADLLETLIFGLLETPAAERPRRLDELCQRHATLAEQLRARLTWLERRGFFTAEDPGSRGTQLPSRLGDFRLARLLGSGGMGIVFEAYQESLGGRRVALKLIRPELLEVPRARERFQREAMLASKLDHPGLCAVYELGEVDGRPYLAMRYVEGEPLSTWIARSRQDGGGRLSLPGPESADARNGVLVFVEHLARAAHAAHEAGLVHRDLKPGNVMVDPAGQPVILDFGLAKSLVDDAALTATSAILGSPMYMAPEQISGGIQVDRRADVWALGTILFECLRLEPPFQAQTREDLFRRILNEAAPGLRRDFSRDLETIVHTALAREPDRRYETALAMAEDLRRLRAREPIRARRASVADRALLWARRNPVGAAFVGVLALGLLSSLVLLWRGDRALADSRFHAAQARARLAEYERMRDVPLVADLLREAEDLWPAHPDKVGSMARWLERAREVEARWEKHVSALAELRARALPPGEEVLREEAELIALRKQEDEKWDLYVKAKTSDRESARRRIPRLLDELATLEANLLPRERELEARRWQFEAFEDRFLHQTLTALVRSIEELVGPKRDAAATSDSRRLDAREAAATPRTSARGAQRSLLASMEARRAEAETLAERSIGDEKGSESARRLAAAWSAAAQRVARDPRFAGFALRPQVGLVPLGPDPESRLEEFGHLLSGALASRDPSGRVVIADETGIVLVLIPCGTFTMGVQKDDPDQPNYDPMASDQDRPVQEHRLDDPYFLAKHEMTQGQWLRIAGKNPSSYGPDMQQPGGTVTLRNPIEQVSWDECVQMLARLGLVLPSEGQWEHAARGGTPWSWWTGSDKASLAGAANIADRYCKDNGGGDSWLYDEDLDDGHTVHAPVGSFRANPFGLWDVIGNVREWCETGYVTHEGARPGVFRFSGESVAQWRGVRGGAWKRRRALCEGLVSRLRAARLSVCQPWLQTRHGHQALTSSCGAPHRAAGTTSEWQVMTIRCPAASNETEPASVGSSVMRPSKPHVPSARRVTA